MEKTTQNSIKKIAILGAESTGKSVLSEQLAQYYQTVFVPEYARTYFDNHDINDYNTKDIDFIAQNQLKLEQEYYKKANHFLFCDTTLITAKIWSLHKFNVVSKFISNSINAGDYDLYLILNNDVKWQADPQRKNENLREHLFKWNKHELEKLNIDYKIVSGVGEEKLKYAIKLIDEAFKD